VHKQIEQFTGMTIVDGRRWRIKPTVEEERNETLRAGSKEQLHELSIADPTGVEIVMRADINAFFVEFMKTVFGINWNAERHAWTDDVI
jgi:hypothetical protein